MLSRNSSALMAAAALLCGTSVSFGAMFEPLFLATKVVGDVKIEKPAGKDAKGKILFKAPEPLLEDHAYPYNSRITVPLPPPPPEPPEGVDPEDWVPPPPPPDPDLVLKFSSDFRFHFAPGTVCEVRDASSTMGDEKIEVKKFSMESGVISTLITATATKTGGEKADAQVDANLSAIEIETPVASATRLSGKNEVKVEKVPGHDDFYLCTFRTESGLMEVNGRQFRVHEMKRNACVEIEGTDLRDMNPPGFEVPADADPNDPAYKPTFSRISNNNGLFSVSFEKGLNDDDTVREQKYVFSSRCFGKVWREFAEVGQRMAVSVMAVTYPKLKGRSNAGAKEDKYCYLEGQKDVGDDQSSAEVVGGQGEFGAEGGDEGFGGSEGGSGDSGDDWGGSGDSGDGWGDLGGDDTSSSSGGDDFNWDDF